MNQFAKMSTQQFCNWVACNPGGAEKAYKLRVEDNPECDNVPPRVITKTEYVESFIDRVVIQESVIVRTEIKYVTSWEWVMNLMDKVGSEVASWLPEPVITQGVLQ